MKFRWYNAKENREETSEGRLVFCKDCAHLCYEAQPRRLLQPGRTEGETKKCYVKPI